MAFSTASSRCWAMSLLCCSVRSSGAPIAAGHVTARVSLRLALRLCVEQLPQRLAAGQLGTQQSHRLRSEGTLIAVPGSLLSLLVVCRAVFFGAAWGTAML